jgi:hypothetical protein
MSIGVGAFGTTKMYDLWSLNGPRISFDDE